MVDVLLIRPPDDSVPLWVSGLPFSFLYTSASLVEAGYTVKVVDQVFESDWKDKLLAELKKNPLCVGITTITGKQLKCAIGLAKLIKSHSDVPIVVGGVHVTLFPKSTLEHPCIDIVVKGEGEETFLELVKNLEKNKSLKDIKGIGFKEGNRVVINPDRHFIDLNKIPELPFHLFNMDYYIKKDCSYFEDKERTFDLITSRGCLFDCYFCYNKKFFKNTWRYLKSDKVIEQVNRLKNEFGIDSVMFVEDNYFVNKQRVEDIAKKLLKEKMDIDYFAKCRIDTFSRYSNKDINLLRKSGCSVLQFGIESGSQKILDLVNKNITINQIKAVNKKLKKYEFFYKYGFVVGFPYETKEDTIKTIQLIDYLIKVNPRVKCLTFSIYTPYPGTKLFDEAVKLGLKLPRTLEEWSDYTWYDTKMPWIAEEHRRFLKKCKFIITNMPREDNMGLWLKLRFKFLKQYSIAGPLPERFLFRMLKKDVYRG